MNLKQKQFLDQYIGLPLVHLHILITRFLGWVLRRDHNLDNLPGEICIIKLLGWGSIVMASDAIYSLKIKYPAARLSIVCSRSIESGIRSLDLFEEIYVIDDGNFFKLLLTSVTTILRLQKRKRLWVIDLEVYSKLTGILSLWTLAINRFGFYFNQVRFRYKLYTHNIYFNTVINVEDNYSQMIKALGVDKLSPFHIKGYPPRFKNHTYTFIALNNTCSELAPERKLKHDQLYDICKWITENTAYKIALLGAPSDYQLNERFIQHHDLDKIRVLNIAGKYGFNDYYTFLYKECVMMITIDSAPLHIANKLNIPNLSIWGPTSPQSRINLDSKNEYFYAEAQCSPCAHFVDKLPCNGDNFCINKMKIKDIAVKIQNLIQDYEYK